jgi:hypothetical protein
MRSSITVWMHGRYCVWSARHRSPVPGNRKPDEPRPATTDQAISGTDHAEWVGPFFYAARNRFPAAGWTDPEFPGLFFGMGYLCTVDQSFSGVP